MEKSTQAIKYQLEQSIRIVCVFIALCSFGALSVHAHDEGDLYRAKSRGKVETYAREDWEFRLPSTAIRSYSLADFQDVKYVVLVAMPWSTCPDLQFRDWILKANKIGSKRFQIVAIDPTGDPRGENALTSYRDKVEKDWPAAGSHYLFDAYQAVSSSLLFKNKGDFAVFDPTGPYRLHSGGMDEFRSLTAQLLKKYLLKVPALSGAQGDRCPIEYRKYEQLGFKEMFLTPFSKACQSCHVRSEVYDIFRTLQDVVGWRAMSLRTIRLDRMPGVHDPFYLHPGESNVAVEDLRRIVHWLSDRPALSPEMESQFKDDHLRRTVARDKERAESTATSVSLSIPVGSEATIVPAEGALRYYIFKLGTPLKEDLVLQGVRANLNLNIVHHANILALPPEKWPSKKNEGGGILIVGRRRNFINDYMSHTDGMKLTGSLNGKSAEFAQVPEPIVMTFSRRSGLIMYPRDQAFVIPKGTQLGVELHVEPSGVAERLEASFEFLSRSSTTPFRELKRFGVVPVNGFKLLPNLQSYKSVVEVPILKPTQIHKLWFHAHYRGVAARFRIRRKNQTETTIASFPFLQMKIGPYREFSPSISLDSGDRLIVESEYDNSRFNSANPDPSRTVPLGGSTLDDEMHFARFVISESERVK